MFSIETKFRLKNLYRSVRRVVEIVGNVILFLTSFVAVLLIVYRFGFPIQEGYVDTMFHVFKWMSRIFFVLGILRFVLNFRLIRAEKGFWIEVGILLLLLGIMILQQRVEESGSIFSSSFWIQTDKWLTYITIAFLSVIQLSKQVFVIIRRRMKPEILFVCSFLFLVFVGAVLLQLPLATYSGISFLDALFTSTSAVCVTGLTVVDTATVFTPMGQVVILLLIQLGGLGIMTFTSFFAMTFLSGTSFREQFVMQNLLNEASLSDIFRTVVYIVLTTLIIEGVGTYLVYLQVQDVEGISNKFFFSLFHAVSAFCNAGFSTLSGNLYDPLIRELYNLQLVLAFLVILGGIGFPILFNYGSLLHYRLRNCLRRWFGTPYHGEYRVRIISSTTRVVLPVTLILLVVGTALYWIFENNHTLAGMSLYGKFVSSFMGAVTPRTAGFANVDMTLLSTPAILLLLVLMWIGASPMSTGGGIKTTTFYIALRNVWATLRGQERIMIDRRQLTQENVNRAYALISLSVVWIVLVVLVMLKLEPGVPFMHIVFEVVSALGTVGSSLGITPDLSTGGKIVISLTMFVGRVGLMTLLACFVRRQEQPLYTYPDDTLIL